MTTEPRRSTYLLLGSDRRDYGWFRLATTGAERLDHPEDWRNMVPPNWESLERYVRPGGLTLVLFRTPSDSGVLVMGLPSDRLRMGSPLTESILVTERSTSGGVWVRGLAAAALRSASDQEAGELAPLLRAIEDAPSTEDGLKVDPEAFAAAASALASATTDSEEPALPAGVWLDTPLARRRLAATPVWDGDVTAAVEVVAAVAIGVRSERLEGVRWALTSHPTAADSDVASEMPRPGNRDEPDAPDDVVHPADGDDRPYPNPTSLLGRVARVLRVVRHSGSR